MSAWSGKYVIGLTGNIATGKSVVRQMLEHLGAYGIDADGLAHRAMAKDAPGYPAILDYFGRWVLAPDGQIDRARLGKLVFSNPEALLQLEKILHPLVRQAVNILVKRANQKVIVIEAIKLLESPLREMCNSIWVTHTSEELQVERLMKKRGLSEKNAWMRITAQSPQSEKLSVADVKLTNTGSFEKLWYQVLEAWKKSLPEVQFTSSIETRAGDLSVQRAYPQQAAQIAAFLSSFHQDRGAFTRDDVMASFGEKAFMLLLQGDDLVGLVGWQVENLVARIVDIYIKPKVSISTAVPALVQQVEKSSRELQSEAALVFTPPEFTQDDTLWSNLGYKARTADSLNVRAWQEAARESQVDGTLMFFKLLRQDRVLRPI